MAKSYKNTILPAITLKYFKRPEINSPDFVATNFTCHNCGMKNMPFVGAVKDGNNKNQKYFCEDCAIDAYMKDYDFKSREAAASWRRRIFDVGYLLNELLLDSFAKNKNKKVEDLSSQEWEEVVMLGTDFYNTVSKEEKEWLEASPTQKELEKDLKKLLRRITTANRTK